MRRNAIRQTIRSAWISLNPPDVHAHLAGDASGDPVPATRDQIRGTRCATATLDDQPAAVGDHRPARRSPVERRWRQNDVYVTMRDTKKHSYIHRHE